jgi:hypothetical protein
MIQHLDSTYGPALRNRLSQATDKSGEGARAAFESFYYALATQPREPAAAVPR